MGTRTGKPRRSGGSASRHRLNARKRYTNTPKVKRPPSTYAANHAGKILLSPKTRTPNPGQPYMYPQTEVAKISEVSVQVPQQYDIPTPRWSSVVFMGVPVCECTNMHISGNPQELLLTPSVSCSAYSLAKSPPTAKNTKSHARACSNNNNNNNSQGAGGAGEG